MLQSFDILEYDMISVVERTLSLIGLKFYCNSGENLNEILFVLFHISTEYDVVSLFQALLVLTVVFSAATYTLIDNQESRNSKIRKRKDKMFCSQRI